MMVVKRTSRQRKQRKAAPDSVTYYCLKCKRRIPPAPNSVDRMCEKCKEALGYKAK